MNPKERMYKRMNGKLQRHIKDTMPAGKQGCLPIKNPLLKMK